MNTFYWRGKRIKDIEAWARERGEQMVHYLARRTVVNTPRSELHYEEYEGKMPESFWANLHIANGWTYTVIP